MGGGWSGGEDHEEKIAILLTICFLQELLKLQWWFLKEEWSLEQNEWMNKPNLEMNEQIKI